MAPFISSTTASAPTRLWQSVRKRLLATATADPRARGHILLLALSSSKPTRLTTERDAVALTRSALAAFWMSWLVDAALGGERLLSFVPAQEASISGTKRILISRCKTPSPNFLHSETS